MIRPFDAFVENLPGVGVASFMGFLGGMATFEAGMLSAIATPIAESAPAWATDLEIGGGSLAAAGLAGSVVCGVMIGISRLRGRA
ncbi:MAG TPA: hypothetical protein VLH84_04685 [Patescibacteria group bacterium]|nr:hypothetical protein [Patescibacteria group bacterium]